MNRDIRTEIYEHRLSCNLLGGLSSRCELAKERMSWTIVRGYQWFASTVVLYCLADQALDEAP